MSIWSIKKVCGHLVGISEYIDHDVSFLVVLDDSRIDISQSLTRSSLDPDFLNLHLEPNEIHSTVKSDLILKVGEKQQQRQLELIV